MHIIFSNDSQNLPIYAQNEFQNITDLYSNLLQNLEQNGFSFVRDVLNLATKHFGVILPIYDIDIVNEQDIYNSIFNLVKKYHDRVKTIIIVDIEQNLTEIEGYLKLLNAVGGIIIQILDIQNIESNIGALKTKIDIYKNYTINGLFLQNAATEIGKEEYYDLIAYARENGIYLILTDIQDATTTDIIKNLIDINIKYSTTLDVPEYNLDL